MLGTVTAAERCTDGTELELATDDGPQRVRVQAFADHLAAVRVERALRRCVSLRVERTRLGWSAVVRGVGHRRPIFLPVSTATALGLIERGLPTIVRLP